MLIHIHIGVSLNRYVHIISAHTLMHILVREHTTPGLVHVHNTTHIVGVNRASTNTTLIIINCVIRQHLFLCLLHASHVIAHVRLLCTNSFLPPLLPTHLPHASNLTTHTRRIAHVFPASKRTQFRDTVRMSHHGRYHTCILWT